MRNVARTTIVALVGLAVIGTWPAPQAPAQAQDRQQQRIEAAIAKAVEYLKSHQAGAGAGAWANGAAGVGGANHGIGPVALVGIALLECGVAPNDPVIEKAAKEVRQGGLRENRTYQLSLAIQFLDRLGEFNDVPLIQVMSLRLMLGQDARSGGWTYNCVQQINDQEVRRLLGVLPPNARPEDFDLKQEAQYQAALQRLPAGPPGGGGGAAIAAAGGAAGGMGDNSNTQFAVLTLWIAKRHHVPCDDCLLRAEQRFRSTQSPNGTWGYIPTSGPSSEGANGGTPAMTCAGLIGLAVAHGVHTNRLRLRATDKSGGGDQGNASSGGNGRTTVKASRDPRSDPQIAAGLRALGTYLNLARRGNMPQLATECYFLWSLERVCVVYNLPDLGGIDWHAWGADALIRVQKPDGSWSGLGQHTGNMPDVETALALLFLRQANLAKDLSRLIGRSQPDEAKATAPSGEPGAAPATRGTTNTAAPAPAPVNELAEKIAKLASDLKQASGGKFDSLIEEYTTTSGVQYTEALTRAIPDLTRSGQEKARRALAARMQRMSADTLRDKLQDRRPEAAEVRLAAARACIAKNDHLLVPDLIEALIDDQAAVRSAAHDALRAITRQDFGPADGASERDRDNAIRAWKSWWKQQRHGQR